MMLRKDSLRVQWRLNGVCPSRLQIGTMQHFTSGMCTILARLGVALASTGLINHTALNQRNPKPPTVCRHILNRSLLALSAVSLKLYLQKDPDDTIECKAWRVNTLGSVFSYFFQTMCLVLMASSMFAVCMLFLSHYFDSLWLNGWHEKQQPLRWNQGNAAVAGWVSKAGFYRGIRM